MAAAIQIKVCVETESGLSAGLGASSAMSTSRLYFALLSSASTRDTLLTQDTASTLDSLAPVTGVTESAPHGHRQRLWSDFALLGTAVTWGSTLLGCGLMFSRVLLVQLAPRKRPRRARFQGEEQR